ncbi:unnamed protein product [Rotaria socialis]|uniref:Dedicator of cytokinesis protein 1 n=1 Tax=Rotaria socialis TaxID=392032 RepID=A0A820UXI1_9BILA|nr:unnamed protein product [Rotaria socialis]CAF4491971.1 unnamed protein product [Rotaria socialis]
MSSWEKFKDKFANPIFHYGVAICSFTASSPDQLSLLLGDGVHVREECDEWYFGSLASNSQVSGIFPKIFVHLKPVIVDNNQVTSITNEDSLANDLIGVLREWAHHIEQFYKDDQKVKVNIVSKLMTDLIRHRHRLMCSSHTQEELIELKQTIVDLIDQGTRLLQLDLIIRDQNLNVANSSDTSTHELLNSLMRIEKKSLHDVEKPRPHPDFQIANIQSMLVTLDKIEFAIFDNIELWCTLYDYSSDESGVELIPSETFVIRDKEALRTQEHIVAFTDISRSRPMKSVTSMNTPSVKYLVLYVIRIGTMNTNDNNKDTSDTSISTLKRTKNETNDLRRPYMVALINMSQQLDCHSRMKASSTEKELIVPFGFNAWDDRDSLVSIFQKAAKSTDVELLKKHRLKLQILSGGFRELKTDYPHLLHGDVCVCRKLDFPDVINADDLRNDIYVTVHGADFAKSGNYEYTAELCDENENPIPGLLNVGVNSTNDLFHRSIVCIKTEKPKWSETFRIAIPFSISAEDMHQYHVRFLFKQRHSNDVKDKSEKPFALAFLPLIEKAGTVIQDGHRHLVIYKITQRKSDTNISGYINLQAVQISAPINLTRDSYNGSHRLSLDEASSRFYQPSDYFSPSYREHFLVKVKVVSTQLTQIPIILTLLTWTPKDSSVYLLELLEKFVDHLGGINISGTGASEQRTLSMMLPSDIIERATEVVKNLQNIFDKLFEILTSQENELKTREQEQFGFPIDLNKIHQTAFHALICILDLISMKQFESFRTVLDDYIKNKFSSTLTYSVLLHLINVTLTKYVENTKSDLNMTAYCVKMLKQLEYFFKLIVRSRVLYAKWKNNADQNQFDQLVKSVLRSFTRVLTFSDDHASAAQGLILRLYPSVVLELLTPNVFNAVTLSEITALEFLAALPPKRLTPQKLRCLNDLARGLLIKIPESRRIILKVIVTDVSMLCNNFINEKQNSDDFRLSIVHQQSSSFSIDQKDRDHLNLCSKIVGHIMNQLFTRKTPGDTSIVVEKLLRVFMQILLVIRVQEHDLAINFATGIIAILRTMDDENYIEFLRQMDEISLHDFFLDAFGLIKDLVTIPIFSNDWSEMLLLQNLIFVRAMNKFVSRLVEDLNHFNEQSVELWQLYFECIVQFIIQPCLQLESFTANKRKRILSRYKDLRIEASNDFKTMWFCLHEQHKLYFIPSQIYGVIRVSLLPVQDIRTAMIRVLCDMIYVINKHEDNLSIFENEFVTVMDKFANEPLVDKIFKEYLINAIDDFCKAKKLARNGSKLVDMIDNLLSRIIELRVAVNECETAALDLQMHCVRSLMEFYERLGHLPMYIKYIYQLYEMNRRLQNKIEAGHTLMLHAKLLDWNPDKVLEEVHMKYTHIHQSVKTHDQLKKKLYRDIIQLFDDGDAWEKSIEVCKELQIQYEQSFEYANLSALLLNQSRLYVHIMDASKQRFEQEYFRIGCYGMGFHDFLQNQVFVYRSEPGQRLGDVREKLQTIFPHAILLDPTVNIEDHHRRSTSQYVQVQVVQPISDEKAKFKNRNIPEAILQYYRSNEIRRFTYTRLFVHEDDRDATSDIAKFSAERYEFSTAFVLPNTTRWVPAGSSTKTLLTPLENAIHLLEKTNRELKILVEANEADRELNVTPLSGKTAGILDAVVMGGASVIEQAFLSNEYQTKHPDEYTRALIDNVKQLLADQVPLLERALIIMRQKSKPEMLPHVDHLNNILIHRQRSVEQHCGKQQSHGLHLSIFVPSTDISANTSIQSHRSNAEIQSRQSDLTRSRTSSTNSTSTIFKPTSTSSPQKTTIELREQLTSVRPRRPPRTAPSLSSSVSSLAGASNDSPRSSTTDMNISGQFVIASASQTLLSSESLNEELNSENLQAKLNNINKKPLSPTHQLANKIRSLTKSSEQLSNDIPPRPPPKPHKFPR